MDNADKSSEHMATVFNDLKIKLAEAKDYTNNICKQYVKENLQSKWWENTIRVQVKEKLKAKRMKPAEIKKALKKKRLLNRVYKRSYKRISRMKRKLLHVQSNQKDILSCKENMENAIIKVNSILHDLQCEIKLDEEFNKRDKRKRSRNPNRRHVNTRTNAESSGSGSASASSESGSDSSTSDGEMAETVTEIRCKTRKRYARFRHDFKCLFKAEKILKIETENYKRLYNNVMKV